MHIKKGDNVIVVAGREKGKQGKVIHVFLDSKKVVVEGLNIRHKHARPRKAGEKGQKLSAPASMDVSNVMLVCSRCGKPTRVARKSVAESGSKVRACKKCKETF